MTRCLVSRDPLEQICHCSVKSLRDENQALNSEILVSTLNLAKGKGAEAATPGKNVLRPAPHLAYGADPDAYSNLNLLSGGAWGWPGLCGGVRPVPAFAKSPAAPSFGSPVSGFDLHT